MLGSTNGSTFTLTADSTAPAGGSITVNGGGSYDNDGTIYGTLLTNARTAATALHQDTNGARLVVWHRNPTGQIIPEGGAFNIIASNVSDKAAQLRSRRD